MLSSECKEKGTPEATSSGSPILKTKEHHSDPPNCDDVEGVVVESPEGTGDGTEITCTPKTSKRCHVSKRILTTPSLSSPVPKHREAFVLEPDGNKINETDPMQTSSVFSEGSNGLQSSQILDEEKDKMGLEIDINDFWLQETENKKDLQIPNAISQTEFSETLKNLEIESLQSKETFLLAISDWFEDMLSEWVTERLAINSQSETRQIYFFLQLHADNSSLFEDIANECQITPEELIDRLSGGNVEYNEIIECLPNNTQHSVEPASSARINWKDFDYDSLASEEIITEQDAHFMNEYTAGKASDENTYRRIKAIIRRAVFSTDKDRQKDAERKQKRRSNMNEDEKSQINTEKAEYMQRKRSQKTYKENIEYSQLNTQTQRESREERKCWKPLYREALNTIVVSPYSVGEFGGPYKCKFCYALHFQGERKGKNPLGVYDDCCGKGHVKTTDMQINRNKPFPTELKELFLTQNKDFMYNIRSLNGDFALGSMFANTYAYDKFSKYNCYRIHGQVYRNMNIAALPEPGEVPKNGQIFFYDVEESIEMRKKKSKCSPSVIGTIENCLRKHNPYVEGYVTMKEEFENQKRIAKEKGETIEPEVNLLFGVHAGTDDRTNNLQTVNEVAAIFLPTAEGGIPEADIVVHVRNKEYIRIKHTDARAEALIYPLLKPNGGVSWHNKMKTEHIKKGSKKTTMKLPIGDFYQYWISYRNELESGFFNPLQFAGRLNQQWIVDQFTRVEQDRLMWYRLNQDAIKAANYSGLRSHLEKTGNALGKDLGRTVILPSDYVGGPRHEAESYYDDMAIAAEKGKPTLFITFTCNGNDPDIIEAIEKSGKGEPQNHPALVCRVFKLKLDELIRDLAEKEVYGKVSAYCYKIEFQKRGLPHAHILLTLAGEDRRWSTETIDKCGIWAKIPQRDETKQLFYDDKENIEDIRKIWLKYSKKQKRNETYQNHLNDYMRSRYIYWKFNEQEIECELKALKDGLSFEDYLEIICEEFFRGLRAQVHKNMCHKLCSVDVLGPHPCRVNKCCSKCTKLEKKDRPTDCTECVKNSKVCTKKFPKNTTDYTEITEDSYPNYKRPELIEDRDILNILQLVRDNKGKQKDIEMWKERIARDGKMFYFGKNLKFVIDNRWIVPYSPWLLMKYRSHINVELVASIKSIKYLFKYIHKGFDKANVKFDAAGNIVYDEINKYLEMRYVSPCEAAWRLLQYKLHVKSHHVERLDVHLDKEQTVQFDVNATKANIENEMKKDTKLTAFFKLCDKYKVNSKRELEQKIRSLIQEQANEVQALKIAQTHCSLITKASKKFDEEIETHLIISAAMHYTEAFKRQFGDKGVCFADLILNKSAWNDYDIPENKDGILYKDAAKYFTWQNDTCCWTLRKSYFKTLGRVYSVPPNDTTGKWHLRVLLFNVRSPRNYDYLKTVKNHNDGKPYETFQEACLVRGLIDDDKEYVKYMKDAIFLGTSSMIRNYFVMLLMYCNPAFPGDLWEMFKSNMVDDIAKRNPDYDEDMLYKTALSIILRKLISNDKVPEKDFPSLPQLNLDEFSVQAKLYSQAKELQKAITMKDKMNAEQKSIFETIENLLLNEDNQQLEKCYFIDGPGGSGKSFVFQAIYHLAMAHGKNIINTAFSGIAATLLENGMTNHKMLKLPFKFDHNSTSRIEIHMPEADLLRKCDIIVWDEAPMSSKYVLDICDQKLREIMGNNLPFGGKIILTGGDFRQVLPVKKYAVAAEVIALCLKKSPLWSKFKVVKLIHNMRANQDEKKFAQTLLDIGNGTLNDSDDNIVLPSNIVTKHKLSQVVFKDAIEHGKLTGDWSLLAKRAILAPHNAEVDTHNKEVLKMLPGKIFEFQSDDFQEQDGGLPLAPEILKGMNCANFSLSLLQIKINAIAIIIRNLILDIGLCNGTRVMILKATMYTLCCIIVSGNKAGKEVLIPRITLVDDDHFDMKLHRKQFPIRLAFAMTINKAQGQTLEFVGLDLNRNVFSHGQLYVGLSRVRSWNSVKVKLSKENKDNKVRNVVWKEVLDDQCVPNNDDNNSLYDDDNVDFETLSENSLFDDWESEETMSFYERSENESDDSLLDREQ